MRKGLLTYERVAPVPRLDFLRPTPQLAAQTFQVATLKPQPPIWSQFPQNTRAHDFVSNSHLAGTEQALESLWDGGRGRRCQLPLLLLFVTGRLTVSSYTQRTEKDKPQGKLIIRGGYEPFSRQNVRHWRRMSMVLSSFP